MPAIQKPSLAQSFRKNILKSYVLIPMGFFIFILFSILYLNQFQSCTAGDFVDGSLDRTFKGATKKEACTKAITVCTYFSSNPQSCKVKR